MSRLLSSREGVHVLSIEDVGELGEFFDVELTEHLVNFCFVLDIFSANLGKFEVLVHVVGNLAKLYSVHLGVAVAAAAGAAG